MSGYAFSVAVPLLIFVALIVYLFSPARPSRPTPVGDEPHAISPGVGRDRRVVSVPPVRSASGRPRTPEAPAVSLHRVVLDPSRDWRDARPLRRDA